MQLGERTLAFAIQAPGLQSKKALSDSLLTLLEPVGARKFACLYVRREGGAMHIERSISNLPRQWNEIYLARGYEATDPVFQTVTRGGAYGYWSELTSSLILNKAAREVMSFAREFELMEGFTRRVMLDGGGMAVVMAAGPDLRRCEAARASLRMAFDVFANEGARMLQRNDTPAGSEAAGQALSRTQLQVLLLRAEGLSNRQVAQRMRRHEKTVECHVTEILRRLDARNMIDAIRTASRQRLIR